MCNYSICWKCVPPPLPHLVKEQWSNKSFSRLCAPNTTIWQMQRVFMQFLWIFSTTYPAVFTVNISTQVEPCFIHKKKLSNTQTRFHEKYHVVDCKITAQLVANKTEARQWTCPEWLSKCWKCQLQREGQLLFASFSFVTYIIFGLHLIRL